MANTVHVPFRAASLKKLVSHLTDDVVLVLVSGETYTPNPATDEFLSIVPSDEIVATSAALTGKSVTSGAVAVSTDADAPGVLFEEIDDDADVILVVHHTGNPATSRIAASYTKRRDALGSELDVSLIGNGSDVRVRFLNGELYKL